MSTCIFCHEDSSTSKSVEHIIPESLGNKHHFLPKGYVCDKCNNYFSRKIEKKLLEQPYFVSMRFRNEIRTKKGNLVKEKMFFPEVAISTEVTMLTTPNGLIASFDNNALYERIKNGHAKRMIAPYIPKPTYPNSTMSRFLAKCAYEYFLYTMDRDQYDLCVQEVLGKENDIFKSLREYARFGKGNYWQYNQRRIYSEGDIVFNQNEGKFYERLHEMKFFVKEYKRDSDNNVELELYFILAISGIEYAICMSDPDISEYQKWLQENKGMSPLKADEEKTHLSLSSVRPDLIKRQ